MAPTKIALAGLGAAAALVAAAAGGYYAARARSGPPGPPGPTGAAPATTRAGAGGEGAATAGGDGPARASTADSDGGARGAAAQRGAAAADAWVDGEVRDATGRPATGARVTFRAGAAGANERLLPSNELGVVKGPIPFPPVRSGDAGASEALAQARSDGAGRFRLEGLPRRRGVVEAAAGGATGAAAVDLSTGHATVAVTLGAAATAGGATVRGRAVDDSGALADVEVWLGGALVTTTGADGRFAAAVGPGARTVEVELRARGHVATRATLDAALDGGEPDVRLARAAGRVTGVVLDERGHPLAGATLTLEGGGGERHDARSDARGELTLDGVGAGPFRATLRAPHRPSLRRDDVRPGDDLRLVLDPGGGVSGEARDHVRGGAPPGLRITVEDAAGERHEARLLDDRGRFEVEAVAAGAATLHASAPGYTPVTVALEVPPGERAGEVTLPDVVVELEPAPR